MRTPAKKIFTLKNSLLHWFPNKECLSKFAPQRRIKESGEDTTITDLPGGRLNPVERLPGDVQHLLETEQAYKKTIGEIKKRLLNQEYFPQWLMTLEKIFFLVKICKLSGAGFRAGLDQLLELKSKDNAEQPLIDWIINTNRELIKLKNDQEWLFNQYRFFIYQELLPVLQNKIDLSLCLYNLNDAHGEFKAIPLHQKILEILNKFRQNNQKELKSGYLDASLFLDYTKLIYMIEDEMKGYKK